MNKERCIFDMFYGIEDMNAQKNGINVGNARFTAGKRLAEIYGVEGDGVFGIPNSAVKIGEGYAEASGVKLANAMLKNPEFGRSFTENDLETRLSIAKNKFFYEPDAIEGKSLVVVDDSIVRGTISKIVVSKLRQLGAKKIHFLSATPLITDKCVFNHIKKISELISHNHHNICEYIGADSLHFLPLKDTIEIFSAGKGCSSCMNDGIQTSLKLGR